MGEREITDEDRIAYWQGAAERALAKQHDYAAAIAGLEMFFERPDGSIGEQPGNGTTLMAIGRQAVAALERAQAQGIGVAFNRRAA